MNKFRDKLIYTSMVVSSQTTLLFCIKDLRVNLLMILICKLAIVQLFLVVMLLHCQYLLIIYLTDPTVLCLGYKHQYYFKNNLAIIYSHFEKIQG